MLQEADGPSSPAASAVLTGFRLLEVSVAPGPTVRRRALAPGRPAVDLVGSGSSGGGVRFYLAGPSEPADLCLASDAEAKLLLAEADEAGTTAVRTAGLLKSIDYFMQADAKAVATRLTEADFQLHRQVRPRLLITWWLGGGSCGPLQLLMSVTESESAWASAVIAQASTRRQLALKQLLRVCRHCWRLGNVNSLMSIALSIMSARVGLGPDCHRRLSKKYRSLWRTMEQLADVSMNHAAYRQLIRTGRPSDRSVSQQSHSQPRQQFLPYLAILCKDLAALRECGDLQQRVGGRRNSGGLVNFERLRLLAREIRSFCHPCTDSSAQQLSQQNRHRHQNQQQEQQKQQRQQLKSPKHANVEEELRMDELIAQIRGLSRRPDNA